MSSFLSSLCRFFSNGLTIGRKEETDIDSSKKNTVVGSHNSFNETNIGTQNNNTKSINITVSEAASVTIGDFSTKTFTLSSNAKPSCIDLSDQAKSILKTMAESGEERLATLEMAGKLEDVHMINTNMPFQINDGIAVLEGITTLVELGYLKHSVNNDSSNIYSLTTKGRDYGKKLLEENRGITSI